MIFSIFSKSVPIEIVTAVENVTLDQAGNAQIIADVLLKNQSDRPEDSLLLLLPSVPSLQFKSSNGNPDFVVAGIRDMTGSLLNPGDPANLLCHWGLSRITVKDFEDKISYYEVTASELDFSNPESDVLYTGYVLGEHYLEPYLDFSLHEQGILYDLGISVYKYSFKSPLTRDRQRWIRFEASILRNTGSDGIFRYIPRFWDEGEAGYVFHSPDNIYDIAYRDLIYYQRSMETTGSWDAHLRDATASIIKKVFNPERPSATIRDHSVNIFLGDGCEISNMAVDGDLIPQYGGVPLHQTRAAKQMDRDVPKKFIQLKTAQNGRGNTHPKCRYTVGIETTPENGFPLLLVIIISFLSSIGVFATLLFLYRIVMNKFFWEYSFDSDFLNMLWSFLNLSS